jgi:hypothetical protein
MGCELHSCRHLDIFHSDQEQAVPLGLLMPLQLASHPKNVIALIELPLALRTSTNRAF